MSRELVITYNGIELHRGDVTKMTWTDSDSVIAVTAEIAKAAATAPNFGKIADVIAQASRQKTMQRKQQLEADTVKGTDTTDD